MENKYCKTREMLCLSRLRAFGNFKLSKADGNVIYLQTIHEQVIINPGGNFMFLTGIFVAYSK